MIQYLILLTFVNLRIGGLDAILYDCISGKPVNETQLKIYNAKNNLRYCTVEVKPCDPNEWKRLDGSCNNLKYPSRGTHNTPTVKLVSPCNFSQNYEPRKAANGCELPTSRKLRTDILKVGKATDLQITQLVSYYILFMLGDINSVHDTVNYIGNVTTCCSPEGKKNYMCTPIKIPADDPVHRYSGITCMNLTRPESFQSNGCLNKGSEFVRYVYQTPVFDLSNTYNLLPGFTERLRTYKHGRVKMEKENGLLFPPTDPYSELCPLNEVPKETRCHKYHMNTVMGSNLINILFYRHHNHIAKELHKLNPSWDDERLFYTARDINIATSLQIYLYELLPILLGKKNMIRDGILCEDGGFRDLYDENIPPQMSDEYVYVKRWFHTIQETTLKLYDHKGHFVKTFPYVNGTTRTGFLAVDDNMLTVTQGSFRQPGGKFDFTIDYDMADRVLGGTQFSSDVAAADLAKGRLLGLQPYIKYREFCSTMKYETFADLKHSFTAERLVHLKQLYENPEDIELMAALWAERHEKGARVPRTLYCLLAEQLIRSISTDRHWYERPNRPHAFTSEQLQAIREVSIAGILCTVGDYVTKIQPQAFCTISSKNPLTSCSSDEIRKLNLAPWKET